MAVRFDADGEDYNQSTTFSNGTCSGCCWVKIDVDRNAFSTFIDFSNAGANAFGMQTDTDGVTWQLYSSSNGTTNLFAATVGTWYFLAFSKSTAASSTIAYWAAADTLALSNSGGVTHSQNTSIPTITVGESGFGGEWLNGTLAAVKVWSGVSLTEAEFQRERFQYLPHRTSNLYSFWPFLEGGTGDGAKQDFSGGGNTLSGGTSSATADGPPISWRQWNLDYKAFTSGPAPTPGGYWQLEENTDRWQLEEANGLWLLEETDPFPIGYMRNFQNTLIRM